MNFTKGKYYGSLLAFLFLFNQVEGDSISISLGASGNIQWEQSANSLFYITCCTQPR